MKLSQLAIMGLTDRWLFTFLELAGVFAFAISGAVAARNRGLDWFGVIVIAFAVACGGGVLRDLCIGAVPPSGLTDWRYLAVTIVAAVMTTVAYGWVVKLTHPVTIFDSLGLGLFAVTGAQKSLFFGHNAELAVLLGMVTGVGGGVIRDVLLNRVPVILQREIYASAALVAATIEVTGALYDWFPIGRTWIALLTCFVLRYLSLRYKWSLPRAPGNGAEDVES